MIRFVVYLGTTPLVLTENLIFVSYCICPKVQWFHIYFRTATSTIAGRDGVADTGGVTSDVGSNVSSFTGGDADHHVGIKPSDVR